MSEKPNSCGGCENRWGGSAACHCSGCHRTFSGVTAFDKHHTNQKCSIVGLTEVRPGIWGSADERQAPWLLTR